TVLDAQHRCKWYREPYGSEFCREAQSIRRIRERNIVRMRAESGDEPQRLSAMNDSIVARAERRRIRFEGAEALRRDFDEFDSRRAARQRLESKCARAGKEVEH